MQWYLSKGHRLYVDIRYMSPLLSYRNKIGICSTVRKNRHGLSPLTTKLKRDESQYCHIDIFLALKWQDKREVYMISTIHSMAYEN